MELGYHNYGEAEDSYIDGFGDFINDKIETTAINLGAKGLIPLGSNVSLVGRIGISKWDYEIKETDTAFPGVVFKADDRGTDIYYGIGAQLDLNEHIVIGLEYTVTKMDVSLYGTSLDHDVENLALSFAVRF